MKQKPIKTVKMATQCCWNYIHEQVNRIATVTEQQQQQQQILLKIGK